MFKKNPSKVAWLTVSVLALWITPNCTKKSGEKSTDSPAPSPVPSQASPQPRPTTPNPEQIESVPLQFALQSIAGEVLFCQNFSTPAQLQINDVESTVNALAGAHAGIPEGMPNPFTLQTLALSVKNKPCAQIPELLSGGYCAMTVQKQIATGVVSFATEQRLFWKDIPTLAQATNIKNTLDAKTALLSSKNAILISINRQISQQRQLLQILQATTGQSALIAEAQALLASLQQQLAALENEIATLEREIKPIQDEMSKQLDNLNTARAELKLACNPGRMGAASAVWRGQ